MASGFQPNRRKLSPNSANQDEDTSERLRKVEGEIQWLEYNKRETSNQTRERLAEAQEKLARLRLDDETSSATRDKLAQVEAEIAREQDSSTIVSGSSPRPSSATRSRDKLRESKEKLNFIQARKSEIGRLFESLKRSQTVDLCFLVDCTGSMDSYINEVKNKIQDLVTECKATFADLVLKVAFVGYRDHCDGSLRTTILKFTPEISDFKTFVGGIKASGGGDAAEDIFGGLEEVNKLPWSAPTRILFHVADAPCHGRRFHDGVLDDYLNGDPRGLRAEDLLNNLEQHRVKYWFAKLADTTDKMVQVFRSILKDPEILQQVKLDSVEELMPAVADSVSSSIREVESVTIADAAVDAYSLEYDTVVHHTDSDEVHAKRRSLKEYQLCKDVPNWKEIDGEAAYVFRNKLPKGMNELHTSLKEECRKRRIQIAARPFAEGTQRIVYYGVDCTFSPSKKVVFKEFKYLGAGLNKLESYKKQMEIQSISSFLAQEFNKQKPAGAKDILFTKVVVISLHERSKPFYCSQEPLIEGPYVKYNSNCGFVNKDAYAASLNAFSHWTYQVTDGYIMVVDLQGVQITSPATGPRFTLTDPALHCKDLTRFCSTNLGKDGMHRFFRTHHCNSICKAMRLTPHRFQPTTSSLSTVVKGTLPLI